MRCTVQCVFLILASAALLVAGQAGDGTPSTPAQFAQQLDQIARTASVMVDGDVCQKIGMGRSVNQQSFIQVKKTLIRLSRLVSFPCDVNLWMPVSGSPDEVQVMIRNENELSQFWVFGPRPQQMFPQMKEVLETGRRITVEDKPGWVSVLAPVYNSLGDIVGLVEVVSKGSLICRCDQGF